MTRVNRLIAEMCPNGVEFRRLGDSGSFYGGLSGKSKKDFGAGGAQYIPYVNVLANRSTDLAETDSVFIGEGERQSRVLHGDVLFTGSSENLDEAGMSSVVTGTPDIPVYLNSFCIGFRWHEDVRMVPGFAAHLFRSRRLRAQIVRSANGVTRFNVSKAALAALSIPVPPVDLQQAIVEVLDQIEQLKDDLEGELAAELAARTRQYKHYRNELLTFEHDGEAEFSTLGDVVRNLDSKRKPVTKSSRVAGPIPYYGANGVQDYVAEHLFEGTYLLLGEDGSVMTKDRSPVVNWAEGRIWVNNHAHVLEARSERVSLRYLYHYLKTVDVSSFVTGSTQPKLNQRNMNSIPIVVPSPEEQDRIAAELDRFDVLMRDLSLGLPAEIAARRKQYEYYRDLLLTFPEKAS